jgi:hypothetical protein
LNMKMKITIEQLNNEKMTSFGFSGCEYGYCIEYAREGRFRHRPMIGTTLYTTINLQANHQAIGHMDQNKQNPRNTGKRH